MNKLKNISPTLLRKLYGTVLIGAGCLTVGIAYNIYTHDRILLLLSILVFIFSLMRGVNLYTVITGQKYEIVDGVCVGIMPKPISRQQKVRVMDADGIESTLHLSKQQRLRIGAQYRFYFRQTRRTETENGFLPASALSDAFLGFECLGEYENAETTDI